MNHNSKPIEKVYDFSKREDTELGVINIKTLKYLIALARSARIRYDNTHLHSDMIDVNRIASMSHEDLENLVTTTTTIIKYPNVES